MKTYAYKEMYDNEMTHGWYIATRELLSKTLSRYLKADAKILDAGCGTGGTINFLKSKGFLNIFGVDNSKEAIKYCNKRGLTNIKLGNINKLPYPPNSFDAIICLDVLYHRGVEVRRAIKEFRRVLKKNGILYLQEPSFDFLQSKHDLAIDTGHRFTKRELTSIVQSGNLNILKATYYNFFLFPLISFKRLKDKFFNKDDKASDVYPLPSILNNIVYIVLGFESALIDKTSLPLGLSLICISQK